MARMPDRIYSDAAECRLCKHPLVLESLPHGPRMLYQAIEATAKRQAGACPPVPELAEQMKWTEAKTKKAFEVLKARGVVKGLRGRPGEYQAELYGFREAFAAMEQRARAAEAALAREKAKDKTTSRLIPENQKLKAEVREKHKRTKDQLEIIKALRETNRTLTKRLKEAVQGGGAPPQAPVQAAR